KLVEEKKKEYLEKNQDQLDDSGFPKDSQLCGKCQTKAAILMDGCLTCLNCGESKCG
ncbi:MAG: NrdJb, partial [Methylophilaceae bacterium]